MKTLSKEEFKKELQNIVTYSDDDLVVDEKDLHNVTQNDLFIIECGDNENLSSKDIVLDMADINHAIMKKDKIIMGSCAYCGANSSVEVIKSIILDFEKNGFFIKNADGVLICFQTNMNYKIVSFADAMEMIYDKFEPMSSKEPDVIWGVSCDDTLEDDYTKATIFISFTKKKKFDCVNNFIEIY